ncbi:unnamed protein product, partial [Phaeothamnion confervicola]
MDELREVVKSIVQQCGARGVAVSELLASFIARTVIEGSREEDGTRLFRPNKALTADAVAELVRRSVERLLEEDSPATETIKMQVSFDSTYLQQEGDVEAQQERRVARLRDMQRAVIATVPRDGADYDSLTALHQKIFAFTVRHAHDASEVTRPVEREVAAALESVFPRLSLKTFLSLTAQEKRTQLDELASIVLGIRLFNQHVGRGGVSLPAIDEQVEAVATALHDELAADAAATAALCAVQQEAVVFVHLRQAAPAIAAAVPPPLLARWKAELVNRRQYLSYLQSLQEDVALSERRAAALRRQLGAAMADLRGLVGNKASVPKELVYPKFDAVAAHWLALRRELLVLRTRAETFAALRRFRDSYAPALTEAHEVVQMARAGPISPLEEEKAAADAAVAAAS